MRLAALVAAKELREHLRDPRALLSSSMMALMGPAVVMLVSLSDRMTEGSGPLILSMLSVFALVSAFAGAIDVAMDATAGERERRSLLPLLLNPIAASEVIVGKWIAVTLFSLAALMMNSAGLIAVIAWRYPAILTARGAQIAIWIGLGLVPLSCLGAAMSVLLAVRCRSTKEAHTMLRFLAFIPMVIGMFLVFFATGPGGLARIWLVVPVVGQQALIGLDAGSISIASSVLLAVITLASAVPVLWGATRMMHRYAVHST